MKKDELIINLRKQLDKIAIQKDGPSKVAEYCFKEHNIPVSKTMDLITDRVSLFDEVDEVIYLSLKQ